MNDELALCLIQNVSTEDAKQLLRFAQKRPISSLDEEEDDDDEDDEDFEIDDSSDESDENYGTFSSKIINETINALMTFI